MLEAKNAKELWNRIAEVYSKGGAQAEMIKMRELVSLRLSEGGSVVHHVGQFKTLAYELNCMGRKLDEQFLCILLMNSLPPSYDVLVTNLESMETNDLTLEKVMQKLQLEEQKRVAKKKDGSETDGSEKDGRGSAFMAGDKTKRKKRRPKQDPRKDPCDNCGKTGHWKKDCWAPGGGAEGKGPHNGRKAKSSVNVASHALFIADSVGRDDQKKINWALDSGATAHMTYDKNLLTDFVASTNPVPIAVAKTGTFVNSTGSGTYCGKFRLSNGSVRYVKFSDVLLVPDISRNLFSVSSITRKGGTVLFNERGVTISDGYGEAVFGKLKDGLYVVKPETLGSASLASREPSDRWLLWHRRLGHLGSGNLRRLVREDMVSGMKLNLNAPKQFCNACCACKSHKLPSSSRFERSGAVLDRIHSDICGPMQTVTVRGYKYFITFIDDHSRMSFVYPMKRRSEALKCYKDFSRMAERQTGRKIRVFKSDGAKEYLSNEFEQILKREGIIRQLPVAYAHQQMGLAERKNRVL